MTKWNEIPFNEECSPEEKAEQFERQWDENGGNDDTPDKSNPYSKENFNK